MYFTAADKARTKIFAMPILETPASSETEPTYSDAHHNPHELTHTGWITGIKPLSNGRIVFARSSMTSPNDIFILSGLKNEITSEVVSNLTIEQLTKFTADALEGKSLSEGEEFWFDGAETKVQGWIMKPPGFKRGEKKKWPIVLLIHGGPFSQWGDQWWIWTFDMNGKVPCDMITI
jgi:dipeptidyl aminopeptidase/acylaminoacyl peptidase